MRKLYAFLAGCIFILAGNNSAHSTPVSPDVANFTFAVNVPNLDVVFTNTSTIGSEPGIRKAFWYFGDGSSQQTPPLSGTQHHYQAAGSYTVCLKIYRYYTNTNDSFLTAQVCKTVVIETQCQADFTSLSVASNALGKYFVAQPSHNQNKKPVRICWNFGDGNDTCIQYPTTYNGNYAVYHLYAHPGNYNACVSILYDGGCQAYKCHPVQAGEPDSCRANFERLPWSSINNSLTAIFKALPWHNNNKKPVRICWAFGDGRDTCINYPNSYTGPYNVTHSYQHPGLYNVCVNIRYEGGCEAYKCKPIQIGRPDTCHADFERIPVSSVNDPLVAGFRALPQHNNNRKPARICWTFGDNRDTCINYPENYNGQYIVTHRYNHPGIYEVCVNIRYYGGCEAMKCKPITIHRPDTCRADFERIASNANNPLNIYFRALPQHNNNRKPSRICWRFGDGRDTCINYTEAYTGQYVVNHHYAHPGLYEVCVDILYFGGCEARKCKPVQLGPIDSCRADFERIQTPNNSLQNYFRALPWHNNNRKPARVCWRFGDGRDTCINYPENYTGQYVVSHLYPHPGSYEVCVDILYFGGCEARKCRPVQVGPIDSCRADFERIPTTASTPLTAGFRALPWNSNNRKPSRICWTFGDGRDTCINYPENYTGQYIVQHHYQQPGQYNVCVYIQYYGGCQATKCKPVVIQPNPPNCSVTLFEIAPSITSLTRGFIAIPNAVPPSPVVRICWYFGDGADTCIMLPATTVNNPFTIAHTYPGPGVYHACVHVRYANGCEATNCREVVIQGPINLCGGYMTDSMIGPRTYKFKGFSIHRPNDQVITWRWTFGDGTTAFGQQVTHTYTQGGNYNVCLYITTQQGCETRICKPLHIPGTNAPVLQLSPNPVINVLNAAFFSTHNEVVTIRILNAMGNVVRTYVRNANVGPNTWSFDLSNLLPGLYSFILQSPNQLASAVFIKQ